MTPEQLAELLQQAHDDWQDGTGAAIHFQITFSKFGTRGGARADYLRHLARHALDALASPPPPSAPDRD